MNAFLFPIGRSSRVGVCFKEESRFVFSFDKTRRVSAYNLQRPLNLALNSSSVASRLPFFCPRPPLRLIKVSFSNSRVPFLWDALLSFYFRPRTPLCAVRDERVTSSVRRAPTVRDGSSFMRDYVVPGMDAATRDLFVNADPDVVQLLLAKTVFVYTLGALRNAPVPQFLKRETRNAITSLRTQFGASVPSIDFINLFNNHALYNAGLAVGHADRPNLQAIIAAAGNEMQGSRFLSQDWQAALGLIS